MQDGVTLKGFDAVYKGLKKTMPNLNKEVTKIFGKYGKLMVIYARKNHKFKTQTGQLERAITFRVDSKQWELHFYIDDVRVYSNGYNYGTIQHDGSGVNYKRSEFSPQYTPKLKNGGVKSDHFMVRAWDKYQNDMTADLQRALVKSLGA